MKPNISARYLDGISSRENIVQLFLTDQSVLIQQNESIIASWKYSQIYVKEDWVEKAGAIIGYKDAPDASLVIATQGHFQELTKKLPRFNRASFIIPAQYHYLFLMMIGAIASIMLLFPLLGQVASIISHLIPPAIEKKFGDLVIKDIEKEYIPCHDKLALENLRKITDRLLIATDTKNKEVDLYLFKSDTPNAYSLPGQKIIILSAFLNQAKSENEIAGVMAHEIGHMAKKDSLEAFIQSQGMNILGVMVGSSGAYGGVAEAASFMQAMNYSRQKEFMADEFAVKLLDKAGYSSTGLSSFLTSMAEKDDLPSSLEIISTHPNTKERIKRIDATVGKQNPILSLSNDEFKYLKNACR